VAVVGAGPAGIAVAEELAREGHACTLYDAWPEPGGVLLYGIPNFKLSKRVLDDKMEYLTKLGVGFIGSTFVGRDVTVDELFAQGFDAVFMGTGASLGGKLAIPGEELRHIYAATEFLVRGNLRPEQLPEHMREPLHVGDDVVVIGGGDTSMDCVRTAVRLGAHHVTCVYRRTEAEMLGRTKERSTPAEAWTSSSSRSPALHRRRRRPRHRRQCQQMVGRRVGPPRPSPSALGFIIHGRHRRHRHRLQRRPRHQGRGARRADEPLEPGRGAPGDVHDEPAWCVRRRRQRQRRRSRRRPRRRPPRRHRHPRIPRLPPPPNLRR
jgi:cation diffusion facilitator CzcD-associated flavoprotein CzcO